MIYANEVFDRGSLKSEALAKALGYPIEIMRGDVDRASTLVVSTKRGRRYFSIPDRFMLTGCDIGAWVERIKAQIAPRKPRPGAAKRVVRRSMELPAVRCILQTPR